MKSVFSEMSVQMAKSLCYFFNLIGILSLKFVGKKFQSSRYLTIKNSFLFISFWLMTSQIPSEIYLLTIRKELHAVKGQTQFFRLLFQFKTTSQYYITFFYIYHQLIFQNSTKIFLNACIHFLEIHSIDLIEMEKFHQKCLKLMVLLCLIVTTSFAVEYYAVMNPVWQSIFIFACFHWQDLINVSFVCYLFLILEFFNLLFENFNEKLKSDLDDEQTISNLMIYFKDLTQLLKKFNKAFVVPLSIATFNLIGYLSAQVQ
jgi:hypothetical protein